jgi:NhaP-type Na+/H+ or K+/H+ antiporter
MLMRVATPFVTALVVLMSVLLQEASLSVLTPGRRFANHNGSVGEKRCAAEQVAACSGAVSSEETP